MVTWTANGQQVTLRVLGGSFVVSGLGPTEGARNLQRALSIVRHRLHHTLRRAHGLSGWSLECTFGGVRLFYGDASPNLGGRGGTPSDVVVCANRAFDARLTPHPAVQNSIEIVKSCWSAREAAA